MADLGGGGIGRSLPNLESNFVFFFFMPGIQWTYSIARAYISEKLYFAYNFTCNWITQLLALNDFSEAPKFLQHPLFYSMFNYLNRPTMI